MNPHFPVGKLPHHILAQLLLRTPSHDPRVILGPGIGNDCAVIDFGDRYLVSKIDPITFATDELGWYAVQVNANDIATTGAVPSWMMVALLLPENLTTNELVDQIFDQIMNACQMINVEIIGGHTEITYGIDRPIVVGSMIGEVQRDKLILPNKVQSGDVILLTKVVPIEATAIIAREFSEKLLASRDPSSELSKGDVTSASRYIYKPGISILKDAKISIGAGRVHAMHDATEGGVYTALWELAEACKHSFLIKPELIPVSTLSAQICKAMDIDPLGAIASGSLLIITPSSDSSQIITALQAEDIQCVEIGSVVDSATLPKRGQIFNNEYLSENKILVLQQRGNDICKLPHPERDEIAKLF